jgi:group I intron endonuclease
MYSHLPQCAGIYLISDIKSNKFYIGSSINVRRRAWQHIYRFKRGDHSNPIMQAIWNNDPNRLNFVCLEELDRADKNTLLRAEQKHLNASSVGKNPLCMNILLIANSHLGVKRRPESIEKLRKVHVGRKTSEETKAKQRVAKLGKVLSEEHKKKIGDACRGKKLPKRPNTIRLQIRKFTALQVIEMRALKSQGLSYSQISKMFNISHGGLQKIINKTTYTDIK